VRVIWFVCSGFQVKKTACNQRNETLYMEIFFIIIISMFTVFML
jgi:hypothetical protein